MDNPAFAMRINPDGPLRLNLMPDRLPDRFSRFFAWACCGAALLLTSVGAAAQARKPAPRPPLAVAAPALPSYAERAEVVDFAQALAAREPALSTEAILQTLAQARYQSASTRLIMPAPPGTPKNWAAYRARFVEPKRLRAGLAFWEANERWLSAAETRWGVPSALIVGLIGVETFYGQQMGNFRAVDALATLAFDFPTGRSDRSGFFRDELGALLTLAQRQGVDPLGMRGSYAGALGWPQFMPSSWLQHAIDFDGDGRIDLIGSPADAIGSVAQYLAAYGWQPGLPTHYPVLPPADPVQMARLLGPDIRPSFTAADMEAAGAALDSRALQHAGLLALVELQNGGEPPTHIAGTQNFWAITRYNASSYYALAVIELGQALTALRTGR